MRRSLYIIILVTVALFSACRKTPVQPAKTAEDSLSTAILKVQDCARLYTSEIKVHKIVTFDDVSRLKGSFFSRQFDIKLPLGSRKVAIPVDATLKAYIDFSGFSQNNVKTDSIDGRRKLTIILPDPQIIVTSSKVDNAGTKEYVSWLRSHFTDAELTNFTRQGMDDIVRSIPQMDKMNTCRLHASRVLVPFFTQAGYKEEDITIVFRKDFTTQDIPALVKTIN